MNRSIAIAKLRELITAFLAETATFPVFAQEYVEFFADNAVDDEFEQRDDELYTALFEKLQWTVAKPSQLDASVGYQSAAMTEAWVREQFPELV